MCKQTKILRLSCPVKHYACHPKYAVCYAYERLVIPIGKMTSEYPLTYHDFF